MLGLGLGLTSESTLRRVAAAAGGTWTPLDLGATLKYWIAADDHGTARWTDDGAGLISSITDKVGGMAITAATTARATWAATSFNSAYAGLTFDGVGNWYLSTSLGTLPTGSTAGSIFVIASNTHAITGTKVLISYGTGAAAGDRRLQKNFVTVSRHTVSQQGTNLVDTVATYDGAHIASGSWSGTTQSGRLDGQDITPASGVIAALNTGAIRFALGGTNVVAPLNPWQGVVSDVIITTLLTTLEHQKLEGWGAWVKGLVGNLPVGHPYKSARP